MLTKVCIILTWNSTTAKSCCHAAFDSSQSWFNSLRYYPSSCPFLPQLISWIDMDMPANTCRCGWSFSQTNNFNNHLHSCKVVKSWVSRGLTKAKELWEAWKQQRNQKTAAENGVSLLASVISPITSSSGLGHPPAQRPSNTFGYNGIEQ